MSRPSIIERLHAGVLTRAATETESLAREFAKEVPTDHVLALHGDLGVGKTTFIRGLAHAWDIAEPVTSPTFNLYFIYRGCRQLIHLDAYRLETGGDLDALMIEDFLQSPWCLAVEWPERIAGSLPPEAWHLSFSIEPGGDAHHVRLETK